MWRCTDICRTGLSGCLSIAEWLRWCKAVPKYDLGIFPAYAVTTWSAYGRGEDAEYLGMKIISGGL